MIRCGKKIRAPAHSAGSAQFNIKEKLYFECIKSYLLLIKMEMKCRNKLVFKGLENCLIGSWGRTLCSYHPPPLYTNPQYTKSNNIDLSTVSLQYWEQTFRITSRSETVFPTGVLNVLSGLLAFEIDSILVDFDNDDVNVNDDLIIECLIISEAN